MKKGPEKSAPRQRSKGTRALSHRLTQLSTRAQPGRQVGRPVASEEQKEDVVLDCGWGRLLFAHTFSNDETLLSKLREEAPSSRDIAFYVNDPHVLVSRAPQEVFLDPSHTFRLNLSTFRARTRRMRAVTIRRLATEADVDGINRVYGACGMVQIRNDFFSSVRDDHSVTYFVAQDETTGEIVGTVTGIDHQRLFNDPARGGSLWCLAVHPHARQPGIGEWLVTRLAEHFQVRGLSHLDLSVMHDNRLAINLYEKLNFRRMPLFAIKRKNAINEKFFAMPHQSYNALNPYARLIVDEATRRGIHVDITDAEGGFFRLSHGGRSIHCRESLSELTSGVAMAIADDKAIARRVVAAAGLAVPDQIEAGSDREQLEAFLKRHRKVVVKPARGEQGRGISIGISTERALDEAIEEARRFCERVLVEACFDGQDLRLVIIDFKLVAAAVRRPPRVVGDGHSNVAALIELQSRRRQAATGGESSIPLDAETDRCLSEQALDLRTVLPPGREITVRRAANLHTGGSIHDVTDTVHPDLVAAACRAARAIDIPVVGIDFMVKDPTEAGYVFIEANERPGLANHEPQPTSARFVDLLFPGTRTA
ncbi:N-acetylglutaminylglutamine synthetase [Ensifer adhaerens]|uniref:N-acetylglutaminylglutamine synthetase n=1 Tax=Ensifer adhaerens TaxID=106592 RepID=UPI003CFF3632